MTDDLTPRQKSVLAFITDFQREYAIAPTVREIAAHLGLRSPGGIHRILNVLKDKGYISAAMAKKRSWRSLVPLPGGGIPLIGNIAGGAPIEAIEHLEETLAISPALFSRGQCFGLRVRGDSMTGAHIMDGDIAIIRAATGAEWPDCRCVGRRPADRGHFEDRAPQEQYVDPGAGQPAL